MAGVMLESDECQLSIRDRELAYCHNSLWETIYLNHQQALLKEKSLVKTECSEDFDNIQHTVKNMIWPVLTSDPSLSSYAPDTNT